MRIVIFINQLGFGGSEKAACYWARELAQRGHEIQVITLADGPRRAELENCGIDVRIVTPERASIRNHLDELRPDVIHAHAPGHPHQGDVLGAALKSRPKIPVVQTNIFGQLENPKEDAWTDFRLFISWTSCVQAARRYFRPLNEDFFRHASVAVYPVYPGTDFSSTEVQHFRRIHRIQPNDIVFGRLSRPEPNKWTDLPIQAFRIAAKRNAPLKLLLREPPAEVTQALRRASDRDRFIILPATVDAEELALTTAALDVVLHTSSIGESFGYGIAEPMNYGKPVIANSTPWGDQGQIELVQDGECGFIASTPRTIANAMLRLAGDADLRVRLGRDAKSHVRKLADPIESTDRVEIALRTAATGCVNPNAKEDVATARVAARYLDQHQFGDSVREQIVLRGAYYRDRFFRLRRAVQLYTCDD